MAAAPENFVNREEMVFTKLKERFLKIILELSRTQSAETKPSWYHF